MYIIKDRPIDTDNLNYTHLSPLKIVLLLKWTLCTRILYYSMHCISIHKFFSVCWAETEITIPSPCTLLPWHSSFVWSTDRRHRSFSDPHFWDPERDPIRLVEAADSHLQCRPTLSHTGVMLSFCTDCSHTSSTFSSQFHFTLPRSQFLFIFYFGLHLFCYLIKKKLCL